MPATAKPAASAQNTTVPNTGDGSNTAAPQKAAPLEEDDEFEDFPAEDWSDTETDGTNGKIKHLWEESWDDDDTSDDFAAQLREELKKAHESNSNESMS